MQLMYANALHRAPDAGGAATWLGQLASGTMDRASVMLGISESPEHQALTAPRIDAGIITVG